LGHRLGNNIDTPTEVTSIKAATLRAPRGAHYDRAIAIALANEARGKIVIVWGLQPDPEFSFPGKTSNVVYRSRRRPFELK
jgi:hypothetical protein